MGALRLYGRGWAKGCDYSGTATRSEFWTFTVTNAVFYVVASLGAVWLFAFVTEDWLGRSEMSDIFFYFFSTIFAIFAVTVIMLAPWTSLFVRRVRDATGSSIAALVFVLIAYAGVTAVSPAALAASLDASDPFAPVFLLLAVVALLSVAVVAALPSRER